MLIHLILQSLFGPDSQIFQDLVLYLECFTLEGASPSNPPAKLPWFGGRGKDVDKSYSLRGEL